MKKITFENLPSTNTPINSANLNQVQDNVEEVFNGTESMGSIVVEDVSCKNLFDKSQSIVASSYTNTTVLDTGIRVTLTSAGTNRFAGMFVKNISKLLGKTLTFSANMAASGTNVPLIRCYWSNSSSPVANLSTLFFTLTSSGSKTFTLPEIIPDGYDQLIIIFYANGSSSTSSVDDYVDYTNIQLEKGSVATDYVAHKEFTNNSPSIITANLAEETSLSTTSSTKVPLVATVNVGDKLSIADGGIVIGTGVKNIKVSATARFDTTAEGNILTLYIKNNGTNYMYANAIAKGNRESLSLTPRVINVVEGNIITLEAQNGSSTESRLAYANRLATYVTVEVID